MAKSKAKAASATKSIATKATDTEMTKSASPTNKAKASVTKASSISKAFPKLEEKSQILMSHHHQISKKLTPGIATNFFQFVKLQFPIVLTLLVLILLLCEEDDNNNKLRLSKEILGPKPEPLFNYEQFKEFYPRIGKTVEVKETENVNRQLLFNADSIAVARHNLAFIVNNFTYLVKQSPFRSDKTRLEQLEILSQLDEFNYTKLDSLKRCGNANLDPSGAESSSDEDYSKSQEVSFVGTLIRWFVNLFTTTSSEESSRSEALNNPPNDESNSQNIVSYIGADLRQYSGNVKDQRNCGASYAFSWNSYAEWHYGKQTGKQMDFSEQFIVDCGHKVNLHACSSGYLTNVKEFSQLYGFELERDYPYKSKQQSCRIRRRGGSRIQVDRIDLTKLVVDRQQWERVLFEQPIVVEVNLPSDILDYKGGVHPGNNCSGALPHAMLLVGHGMQYGQAYWILKNSMGKSWGENGYLRLSRDVSMKKCFRAGYISKFKFKSVNEERFNSFYDTIKFRPSSQADSNDQVNKRNAFDWYE